MLRWLTAGESHGQALVATLEGLPAGVEVTTSDVAGALARRRLGYGRGARMKFEQDQVRIVGRSSQGVTIFRTGKDEKVVSVERLADSGGDDEDGDAGDAPAVEGGEA